MYAVVDIFGYQFKVKENDKINVPFIHQEAGNKLNIPKVLLIDDGEKIYIGDPTLKNRSIDIKILNHIKSDKVLIFKKKRRTGYRRFRGHRENLTEILIEKIN